MNIVGKFVLEDDTLSFRTCCFATNDNYVKCIFCGITTQTSTDNKDPIVLSSGIVNHLYDHIRKYVDENIFIIVPGSSYISYLYTGTGYNENAYDVLLMFPMLLFLIPIDAKEFLRRSKNIARYNIYGTLNTNFKLNCNFRFRMSKLIMKTSYMCVKCRNYYESGLPSLDVVSRHVVSCLKFFAKQKTSQLGE